MIRILHGADLHLDSPFSAFPPEQAQACRALQRQLPVKLVQLARANGCRLLLLAGDVFDRGQVYPETVEALQEALASFDGHVFLSPGNHDCRRSLWDRPWPDNVHIFREDHERILLPELGCCVHGGAFREEVCDVPIASVQQQGYVQIGVYHGEFDAPSSPYRPVTREQIENSGLDYLALGHIHKRSFPRRLGKTWFGWPGVTMSRGFDEPGQCGVFCVELSQGSCAAEFIPIANPMYETVTVLPGMPVQLPADRENTHVRLRFVGNTLPPDREELYRLYGPQCLSLQILDETGTPEDLWDACGDGSLRGLALEQLKGVPGGELAARYLLAALEGREQP